MKKTEILYVTFNRDLGWIEYSLQSLAIHASGFSGIKVVVPTYDIERFLYLEQKYSKPDCPLLIKSFLEYPGKGFVHHLAMKCCADVFCKDADYVLHLDPDCVISEAFTPDSYIIDCKPVLLIEPYEAIDKAEDHSLPGRRLWKAVTETALRFECKHETMCRHPSIHYRWLYPALRQYMELIHQTPFIDFVLRQKNSFQQGFGEFNTLGSYALHNHISDYHIVDRGFNGKANDPHELLFQLRSYDDPSLYQAQIDKALNRVST